MATARAAKARGLDFLQIPDNYYEDLDARFGLDPAFLATLRELNLLYDRDADGEFLHFYTATVGSVFFEMVERRGSYDGYGAPNAPVRHAVQYDHLHQLNRHVLTATDQTTPTPNERRLLCLKNSTLRSTTRIRSPKTCPTKPRRPHRRRMRPLSLPWILPQSRRRTSAPR